MNSKLKLGGYFVGLMMAGTAGWYLSEYQSKSNVVQDVSKDYLVTVNGQGMDVDWFVEQMKIRGGLKPGQFQNTEQKKALLDFLINEEIIYQQALEHGVGDDPAVGRVYKKTVIDKYLTDNLNKKLSQVKVGDSEVESYFNQNQSAYNKPARRRAAIIVAEISATDDENKKAEKYQRIETAREAIKDISSDTTHFGELAKVYSDDRASMYQGGVIGWLINHPSRKYKWDQSLIDALFALEKPGEVSEIISTDSGYYIVRLVAAENVKEKSFDQVKKGIKNQLMQAKQKQLKADFMAALTNGAEVNVNNKMLEAIPALSPASKNNENKPPALPSVGGAQ